MSSCPLLPRLCGGSGFHDAEIDKPPQTMKGKVRSRLKHGYV